MTAKCLECDKSFPTRVDLCMHMVKVHQNEETYKKRKYNVEEDITKWTCCQCPKKFKHNMELVEHMESHDYTVKKEYGKHKTSYFKPHGTFCIPCNKDYRNLDKLIKHHEDFHEKNKLSCDHCDKMFTSKYTLKTHVEIEHDGKCFECMEPNCDEVFKRKDQLTFHHMKHKGEYK